MVFSFQMNYGSTTQSPKHHSTVALSWILEWYQFQVAEGSLGNPCCLATVTRFAATAPGHIAGVSRRF